MISVDWHIHVKSDFPDTIGVGPDVCGPTFTGGHLDPGLACGPSSGNPLCKSLSISPSSALTNKSLRQYTCNPEIYTYKSSFACEAGKSVW